MSRGIHRIFPQKTVVPVHLYLQLTVLYTLFIDRRLVVVVVYFNICMPVSSSVPSVTPTDMSQLSDDIRVPAMTPSSGDVLTSTARRKPVQRGVFHSVPWYIWFIMCLLIVLVVVMLVLALFLQPLCRRGYCCMMLFYYIVLLLLRCLICFA